MINKKIFLFAIFLLSVFYLSAQTGFDGFNFQSVLRNDKNQLLSNEVVNLKVEIRKNNVNGALLYSETHTATTNANGYISIVVGSGSPLSGNVYPDFKSIDWADSAYYWNLFLQDKTNGNYNLTSSKQIFSVPLALYSKKTGQPFYLNKLTDVDITGLAAGKLLKWNGAKWVVGEDLALLSDTAKYATNNGHSVYADSAKYAITAKTILPSDTAIWAYKSGTSDLALLSNHAVYSDTSKYALKANVANFANNTWRTNGNAGTNPTTNFLGTTDATDLIIRTNDTARVYVKASGKIGVGTQTPVADLHVIGNNGLLFQGTFGSGTIPYQGAGSRFMWYPKKAAFRGGLLDAAQSNYWDDNRTGNYSFSFGHNNRAEGQFSISFGEQCHALAGWSAAIGSGCYAYADYSFCAGHSGSTFGVASVSLGRGGITRGVGAVSVGYHCEAAGDYSTAFGYYTTAKNPNTVSMGFQCSANHNGSFVYCDFSNQNANLSTTAANQFMVKASGGFIFYTNAAATAGVSLAPGSGSWASLSDSTKKENFEPVIYTDILEKVKNVHVYTWNYKTQDKSIRHIGPTAQEFSRVFNFGENNTTINTVDIDGVNFAAVKALAEKTTLLNQKTQELDQALKELAELKKERDSFKTHLNELEKTIQEIVNKQTIATNTAK
jgi:hypothetical protein